MRVVLRLAALAVNVTATVLLAVLAATGSAPLIVRICLAFLALATAFWNVVGFVKLRDAIRGREFGNPS